MNSGAMLRCGEAASSLAVAGEDAGRESGTETGTARVIAGPGIRRAGAMGQGTVAGASV